MLRKILLSTIAVVALTGCGTLNNALVEKRKQVEYYRIFDIKTNTGRDTVIDAASNGLGKNVGNATEARPIPSLELPSKPGRFKVVNPLEGTSFARFAGGGGSLGMKMATCDGAVWTANATKNVDNSFNLNLTTCLFEYDGGYHMDMYAHFTKQEGGFMQISRAMANAMVGTPEEWTEKTFMDVVRSVRQETSAEIKLLEGYPKIAGTPWLDTGKEAAAK